MPAESTWTYATANFRRTLLRKAIFGIGISAFTPLDDDLEHGDHTSAENEACENFHKVENAKRVKAVRDYYDSAMSFSELAVLTVVVDCFDEHLLYDCLGDPWLWMWDVFVTPSG